MPATNHRRKEQQLSDSTNVNTLLTVAEVAEQLRVGRTKVYELLNGGEIKRIKIDCSCRVIAASVDAFINRKIEEARNG